MELTILMPCLNEENNIKYAVNEALQFICENNIDGEVLIADNNSTDASAAIATSLGARVTIEKQKGYGAAIRKGISEAKGKYIIMGDCDSTYDFSSLTPFMDKLRNGYAFVIGNRFEGGMEKGAMPFTHKYIGVPFLSWLGLVRYKVDIKDFHCGLRGFDTKLARSLNLHTSGMEFATELIAAFAMSHASIAQVPTTLRKSNAPRNSHLRTIRDALRHISYMFFNSSKYSL